MKNFNRLRKIKSENQTGFKANWQSLIPQLRPCKYRIVEGISMGGDAPKSFIKWYKFGYGIKANWKSWPAYIVKSAEKWYSNECITEYLLNRMGAVAGLNMAQSEIRIANEQIRFLSRYFLRRDENLMHGAQIYATYLLDDNLEFVRMVEKQKMENALFPFQEAERAIRFTFHEEADQILENLVKLLVFDALVGNSDRHFYNWGVVTNVKGKRPPYFSPIFDTARGLFWNDSESKIQNLTKNPVQCNAYLTKYTKNSIPKMGWEGEEGINHFRFINLLYHDDGRFCHICHKIINLKNINGFKALLDTEFKGLFSNERSYLIKKCLDLRFASLDSIIN